MVDVSVCCICFNQEEYIESTIESFLNQKTNFTYEIIIHDDNSSDSTPSIIENYHKKFPDIIKPIYEKENQYSKGRNILQIAFSYCCGKYIALCEGDDFWIDSYKLQKQYDYFRSHSDCTYCFTNGIRWDLTTKKYKLFFDPKICGNEENKYTLANSWKIKFLPTASVFFPSSNLKKVDKTFWETCPLGDLKLRLFFTGLGYAYLLNEVTCVYRENVPNSSLSRAAVMPRKSFIARQESILHMLDNVEHASQMRFHSGIEWWREKNIEYLLFHANSIHIVFSKKYYYVFKKMEFYNKIRVLITAVSPEWFYRVQRIIISQLKKD